MDRRLKKSVVILLNIWKKSAVNHIKLIQMEYKIVKNTIKMSKFKSRSQLNNQSGTAIAQEQLIALFLNENHNNKQHVDKHFLKPI